MGRYSNRFVLCILVNGQVQKDLANGEVHIPFGSEYAVRVRNKNNRRAQVELVIDGESVGTFVVKANGHLDIKRWADKDVAFKFVDLESPDAYDHGKQGPNHDKVKGTVEARFRLEKEAPVPPKVEHIHHYHPYPITLPVMPYPMPRTQPWYEHETHRVTCDTVGTHSVSRCATQGMVNMVNTACVSSMSAPATMSMNCSAPAVMGGLESLSAMPAPPAADVLKEGCTVEGNVTGQQWVNVSFDPEETETVLAVFLKGYAPHSAVGGHVLPPHIAQPKQPAEEAPGRLNCGESLGFCPHCGKPKQDKMHLFCCNCGNRF